MQQFDFSENILKKRQKLILTTILVAIPCVFLTILSTSNLRISILSIIFASTIVVISIIFAIGIPLINKSMLAIKVFIENDKIIKRYNKGEQNLSWINIDSIKYVKNPIGDYIGIYICGKDKKRIHLNGFDQMAEMARLIQERIPDNVTVEIKQNIIDYEKPVWCILSSIIILAIIALVRLRGQHLEEIFLIVVFAGVAFLLLIYRPSSKSNLSLKRFETILGWMIILCIIFMLIGVLMPNGSTSESLSNGSNEKLNNFRIIKKQAGEPDATGWIPAHSTSGGFFVYLPALFNELELPPTEMDGENVAVFGVAANLEGIKVTAQFWKYQNGILDIEAHKKRLTKKHKWSKYFTRINESSFAGKYPLLEMEIKTPKLEGISQTIITSQGMYLLTVEYKKASERNLALAKRFFDSFKIITPQNSKH